jgi:hypothetical protein
MNFRLIRLITFTTASIIGASHASADPATFTYTGSGSGSLNGVAFSNTPYVITADADTANRTDILNGYSITHSQASISLQGIGAFDFLIPTRSFSTDGGAGMGRADGGLGDLLYSPVGVSLAGWDMRHDIGPVSGTTKLLQWSNNDPDILTTGGILVFNTADALGTFQATVVPEPSTLALLVFACVAIACQAICRLNR